MLYYTIQAEALQLATTSTLLSQTASVLVSRVLECWDLNAMHHYERDVVVESFRALQHVHLEQASVDDLAVLAPDHLPNLTCLSIATPTGLQHHATLDGLMLERLQYLRLPHCDVQLPCYDLWLKCRHALECGCGVNVTWQGIWW